MLNRRDLGLLLRKRQKESDLRKKDLERKQLKLKE